MKSNFAKLILDSFGKTYAPWFSLISIAVAFFSLANAELLIKALVFLVIFLATTSITFAHAAYKMYELSEHGLSKLLTVRELPHQEGKKSYVYLLEPSELFSHDTLVSVYYDDSDGFELFLALGRVTNIQEDGKIQIEIIKKQYGHDALMKKLEQNDGQIIKKTKIKPNVPQNVYQEYREIFDD